MARIYNTGKPSFGKQLQQFNQFKQGLPRFIGTLAVGFYKESFRRQGFIQDTTVEKWATRKAPSTGSRRKVTNRAILVKTGRLRRSIRIVSMGLGYVVIGTDVPYARIHNEGGTIKTIARVRSFTRRSKRGEQRVRSHSRKMNTLMPRRQFMGASRFLDKRIIMNIDYKLKRILNTV